MDPYTTGLGSIRHRSEGRAGSPTEPLNLPPCPAPGPRPAPASTRQGRSMAEKQKEK